MDIKKKHHGPRRRMRCGFTLVELLVVIAIIALLLSILMPSLGRAREQTKKVICQSNLRNINIGMVMYTNDNNGYFPLCGDAGSYGGHPEWIYYWWPEALTGYLGMSPGIKRPKGLSRTPEILYETNWGRGSVYFCPSDKRTGWGRGPTEPPGTLPPWTSYGMNEFSTYFEPYVAGYVWNGNKVGAWTKWGSHSPSTHMLLAENDGRSLREEIVSLDGMAPRHSWTMNILYVDGHIESVKGPKQGQSFAEWWSPHGWGRESPYMEIGQYWLPHSWVLGR